MTAPNRTTLRKCVQQGLDVTVDAIPNGDHFIDAAGQKYKMLDNSEPFCLAKTVSGRPEMFSPFTRVVRCPK